MVSVDELEKNLVLHRELNNILKHILAENDKALIANLLDLNKKIILDIDTLEYLLELALNEKIDIIIEQDEDAYKVNCCGKCKVKISIYNKIKSIKANKFLLSDVEPELCNYFSDVLGISLTKTYIKKTSEMIKITREQNLKQNNDN